MSEATTIADYDTPDEPTLELEQAVEVIRDGVSTDYGDRITPKSNLIRLANEVFGHLDTSPVMDPRLEFTIWRYQHDAEIVAETIDLAVEDAQADGDDRLMRADELTELLKIAGYRRLHEEEPY
ncbi:hypothetical protein EXE48_11845 [Halorubrum sp. ASP1]|uniref:hypothetical protein n=1 Tax=Halorubrum sp. ASP1 TaxID=2518114 RepID=UPI0010F66703|nr:hypothetical protein [Halorubrum sp. ASP1]TKX60658.1 hypothetical protein EXE48_11845 [Halorubrum sp. ASP1]